MNTIRIDDSTAGGRLDRLLRKVMPHTPLSAIFSMLRKGQISVNGKRGKENYRLVAGDIVVIKAEGEDIVSPDGGPRENLCTTNFFKKNFKVVFEDDDLLVCDKPIGLVVHAGAGHETKDTLIDLAEAYLSRGGKKVKPALVHRIDRDTSGIILIAKNKAFLRDLTASFDSERAQKTYAVLCHGTLPQKEGLIDLPLSRTRDSDDEMMRVQVDKKGGQSAKTLYKVIRTHDGLSRVEATLLTGRTHQIRVHLSHLGCPIVGDRLYGDAARDEPVLSAGRPKRLYLHAMRIAFVHPRFRREVSFEVPPPDGFTL